MEIFAYNRNKNLSDKWTKFFFFFFLSPDSQVHLLWSYLIMYNESKHICCTRWRVVLSALYMLWHNKRLYKPINEAIFPSSPRMSSEIIDWCIVGPKIEKVSRQKGNWKLLFFIYVHLPKTGVKIFHKTVSIRGIEFPLKYSREWSSLASGFLYLLIHGSSLSLFAQEQETEIRKGRQQKRKRERDVCICQHEWD